MGNVRIQDIYLGLNDNDARSMPFFLTKKPSPAGTPECAVSTMWGWWFLKAKNFSIRACRTRKTVAICIVSEFLIRIPASTQIQMFVLPRSRAVWYFVKTLHQLDMPIHMIYIMSVCSVLNSATHVALRRSRTCRQPPPTLDLSTEPPRLLLRMIRTTIF